jgi:phosphatidylglycerol:prolipoprotein diacylglycerol transferase
MLGAIEPLDRVFIQLGPFPIYWYGVIIGTGVLIGLLFAIREGERRGLPKETFIDLVLYAVPIAILCARTYYVLFNLDYYLAQPSEIINIRQGGLAIHGGLIGAVITAIVFARKRNISFWKLADIAAPSILLGQAIGRWGNFMNQEAHGGPVTREFLESFHLPEFIINNMYIDGTYYHPTFLYESLWNFAGVAVLLLLRKANLRRGEMFFSYLMWYSFGRFFIEGLRTDSLMLGPFRIAQIVSIALFAGALIFLVVRRKAGYAKERYLEQ